MTPPTNIDGTDISGATIDGQTVQEITVDGDTVFTAIPDSVVSRPDDDSTISDSETGGVVIETKTEWPSIGARISNNTTNATKAYLRLNSDGSLIQDTDISALSSGDAFTFDNVDLSSGVRYQVVIDAEGVDYTRGFADNETGYPFTSTDVDIVEGHLDGSSGANFFPANVNDIGNVGF